MPLENISGLINDVKDTVNNLDPAVKVGALATAAGAAILGGAAVVSAVRKKRSKSKAKNRKSSHKSKSHRRRKRRSIKKYARTAGKRKDRSRKRIRMTKNGQPYIITRSGKAKFISKRSASLSRKRKGGRY